MRDHIAEYSIIPPADILATRDITRYRRKTINEITAEKNRMSNCLTVSCIKLDEVVSDVYGKTGKAIIGKIIETGGCNFDPAPYIDRRVKSSLEAFKMALDGNVTLATHTKMTMIQKRLDYLGNHKAELKSTMASLSKDYSRQLEILDSAPGVETISAISILSEIGANMKQFGSVKRFLSWVGVVPQNNESAGKKKSTRIGKGNTWLKPVLVQCANAAIKDKKHPEMREKYPAIKKRRGHGKAVIAIAKRIMTAIYYMLLKDELYNPNHGKDKAPKRGKIDLAKLIGYYQQKDYTVIYEGNTMQTEQTSCSLIDNTWKKTPSIDGLFAIPFLLYPPEGKDFSDFCLQRHSNSSCPIAMPYYNKTVNYLPGRSVNYLGGLYTVPARGPFRPHRYRVTTGDCSF
jgi:hypothetical protein